MRVCGSESIGSRWTVQLREGRRRLERREGQASQGLAEFGFNSRYKTAGCVVHLRKMLLETPWRRILRSDDLPDLKDPEVPHSASILW